MSKSTTATATTAPGARAVATRAGRRSLPLAVRVFVAIILTVFAGIWAFGTAFTIYQDRATAATLAPFWAAAIRASLGLAPGQRASTRVEVPIEVLGGEPPANAVDLTGDARMAALTRELAGAGLVVQQWRLDDTTEPPITWVRIDRGGGTSRWAAIVGGLQPSDFWRRLTLALAATMAIVVVFTALVSRWVSAPASRLVDQLDAVGRGELPAVRVRGAREIERLGDALHSMAERRNAVDEQTRAMLLGVSHDLRSPLARIRVAADLLEGESSKLRDLIVRNVEQTDAIVDSFLAYVRADAETPRTVVDLTQLARVAAELAQLPPGDIASNGPVPVHGDATLLQRAIANLLDNAERHGARPIRLAVRADRQAALAVLTVDDAGPGIADPERLRRAFERGDPARATQGSGLGLAIVDRIVERLGGTVEFARNEGGGASVRVLLPLAQP